MKNIFHLKKLALIFGDIFVFYLALYLTLAARYLAWPDNNLLFGHLWPFTLIFSAWIIIFYIADLYNLHLAVNNGRFFQAINRSILIAAAAALIFFYATPEIGIAPKTNLFIYILVFYVLFFFWRRFYNMALKSYLPKKNVVFIGYEPLVGEIVAELKAKPHLGYVASFIFNEAGRGAAGLETISRMSELEQSIRAKKVSTIVLVDDPHHSAELRLALFNCLPLKIDFINLTKFYETLLGRIPLEALSQMWFLKNLSEGSKSAFDALKRFGDFILSLAILIATAAFWPLIGLAIKADSRGPIFFKQTRVGRNGRIFIMIKFRTMTEAENDRRPTVAGDSRITKLGGFLRKTRLDELPQILNIMKGDMSFVGPRPERPELASELEKAIPFYRERTLVKPGVTGSDQVSGEYHSPSVEDSLKKLQYDLFYIKNRSLYLDLTIILKTIATVLLREGR